MRGVSQESDSLAFLAGGGECGQLARAFDWAKTPLGPRVRWPGSLATIVGDDAPFASPDVPVVGARARSRSTTTRTFRASVSANTRPRWARAGARLLAGDLAHHLAADRRRHARSARELERRPPRPHLSQRPDRRGLLDLRLLTGDRRRWSGRRLAGRLHRDDPARASRATARTMRAAR